MQVHKTDRNTDGKTYEAHNSAYGYSLKTNSM